MKTTFKKITLSVIASLSIFLSNAQTLEESLTTAMQQLDTSRTMGSMMAASANFDMIVNKWPNEYASNYYAAFSKAMTSYLVEKDMKRRDMIIDMADKYLEKVNAIDSKNQETYVLAALIANARLSVDGPNRWKKYGEIFETNLNAAKAINPNNPRIYHLKGVSVFFTPKMFGGGCKNAMEFLSKAKPLFEAETVTGVLVPHWGKNRNEYYISQCNE